MSETIDGNDLAIDENDCRKRLSEKTWPLSEAISLKIFGNCLTRSSEKILSLSETVVGNVLVTVGKDCRNRFEQCRNRFLGNYMAIDENV